jgi:transposase
MGQEKRREEAVEEYLAGGVSLRGVGAKWGIKSSTLHRWVKKYEAGAEEGEVKELAARRWEIAERSGVPAELGRLRKELEEERLRNELLNTMIDIAESQMGIDIRKKRGAKR